MVDDRSLVCHAIEHQVIVSGRMPAVQRGRQSEFASCCSVHMHGAQAGSSRLEGRNCRLGCDLDAWRYSTDERATCYWGKELSDVS
eukprot:5784541-Prymnesium_polylepis.1